LLHGTLSFLEHFAFCVPESKVCWEKHFLKGAKCSREQSVPRSRLFQEAKCAEKQIDSASKVFQGSKCVEEQSKSLQSVSKSKVCVSQLSAITLFGIRPPFLIKEKINIYFLHLSILIYPVQIKVS
jgi:hypothetical protein